jgi:hypothetical protein
MPYYQALLDLIASRPPDERLELIRQLFEAVEAERGPAIPLLTRRVVATVNPVMLPMVDIPATVWHETLARLLYLGEYGDLEELLEWYEAPISFASGRKARITETWAGVFNFVTVPAPKLSEANLVRELKRIAIALKYLIPAHTKAVADEPKPIFDPSEPPPGSFGTATLAPPRYAVLRDGIRQLVAAWMIVHQQLYDAAWQKLGSGSADRADLFLTLRKRLADSVATIMGPPDAKARQAEVEIELARIRYGRSPHHEYLDDFPLYESRVFGFTPYSRDPPEEPAGKRILLSDLVRYRASQLRFVLGEYGEFVAGASPRGTAAAKAEAERRRAAAERRKLIDLVEKSARSLRLDSEDELASFACAFFRCHVAGAAKDTPPAEARQAAWDALLAFLERYLKAYTTHTEFNLDEDPSYFDRLFPRAINGGQLLDCGVYAVRMAYVLLTLAACVRSPESRPARVSFVILPLHVGLIVEVGEFPPVVLHNDVLFRPTSEDLQRWREEWDKGHEPDDPSDPALRDLRFLEDVAAMMFCRDLDLPVARHVVAPVSTPPKKSEITRAYQRLVVKPIVRLFSKDVERPARDEYQFDLRFLAMLTEDKRWFDREVVKFWNRDAHDLWKQVTNDSQKPLGANRPRYASRLNALILDVSATYEDVRVAKGKLSQELRDRRKKVLGPEAQRIVRAARLKDAGMDLGPIGAAGAHLDALKTNPDDVPGFADEAGFISQYRE